MVLPSQRLHVQTKIGRKRVEIEMRAGRGRRRGEVMQLMGYRKLKADGGAGPRLKFRRLEFGRKEEVRLPVFAGVCR